MISSDDFKKITTLIFDIDGTLTDGKCAWQADGTAVKFFDHHDMHWLKLALRAGLKAGVLSGSDDPANRQLVDKIGLSFGLFGIKNKLEAWDEFLASERLDAAECLYMGDDVVDLPLIRRAGIGVAVHDAVEEVVEFADWQTEASGGHGAAMEVVRRVLIEKNLYDNIMERYRR